MLSLLTLSSYVMIEEREPNSRIQTSNSIFLTIGKGKLDPICEVFSMRKERPYDKALSNGGGINKMHVLLRRS
jgi:hypothetical protein